MPHKDIPNIAAILQIAYYASFQVPEYNDLTVDDRRQQVVDDYISSLKMADVIFEKAVHEKLPPDQKRILEKYIKV